MFPSRPKGINGATDIAPLALQQTQSQSQQQMDHHHDQELNEATGSETHKMKQYQQHERNSMNCARTGVSRSSSEDEDISTTVSCASSSIASISPDHVFYESTSSTRPIQASLIMTTTTASAAIPAAYYRSLNVMTGANSTRDGVVTPSASVIHPSQLQPSMQGARPAASTCPIESHGRCKITNEKLHPPLKSMLPAAVESDDDNFNMMEQNSNSSSDDEGFSPLMVDDDSSENNASPLEDAGNQNKPSASLSTSALDSVCVDPMGKSAALTSLLSSSSNKIMNNSNDRGSLQQERVSTAGDRPRWGSYGGLLIPSPFSHKDDRLGCTATTESDVLSMEVDSARSNIKVLQHSDPDTRIWSTKEKDKNGDGDQTSWYLPNPLSEQLQSQYDDLRHPANVTAGMHPSLVSMESTSADSSSSLMAEMQLKRRCRSSNNMLLTSKPSTILEENPMSMEEEEEGNYVQRQHHPIRSVMSHHANAVHRGGDYDAHSSIHRRSYATPEVAMEATATSMPPFSSTQKSASMPNLFQMASEHSNITYRNNPSHERTRGEESESLIASPFLARAAPESRESNQQPWRSTLSRWIVGRWHRITTTTTTAMNTAATLTRSGRRNNQSNNSGSDFIPFYSSTCLLGCISQTWMRTHYQAPLAAATWIGFWALLIVTCANYVLTPMRDAIALQVGVEHMPRLTLASTVLAFCSSVPIGWLFEAPDPNRRRLWKRMGLTRGETQGSSLALFYRCFALILLSYAVGFSLIEFLSGHSGYDGNDDRGGNVSVPMHHATASAKAAAAAAAVAAAAAMKENVPNVVKESFRQWLPDLQLSTLWNILGKMLYIAFFLVVHLMKLHSISLVWGVTTEAMEYEEVARKRAKLSSSQTRLQRMALVGFGGTVGGIVGSGLASSMAHLLRLPGLLILAALLLEVAAELSIELGRIMQKHWEEQQLFQSNNNLVALDTSMKRSASLGSMKRVASGNSINRVKSASDFNSSQSVNSNHGSQAANGVAINQAPVIEPAAQDDTFMQRLLRGVSTILRSRLLMAIFTYNALYASTTVLLSFQRAVLVVNRKESTTVQADTAFLANINMASSVAIFAFQATGLGAHMAAACGPRGTLVVMPLIRLAGVLSLAWWHKVSNGKPPNLLIFLVVDECCKIVNLAIAKPVRESLWRGLSNEARYEAKPIVDTLANRWGGGSAAFLVSFINKTLDLLGVVMADDSAGGFERRMLFGFPPILVLCIGISAWWAAVSVDLGNIRSRIDLELKKRQ